MLESKSYFLKMSVRFDIGECAIKIKRKNEPKEIYSVVRKGHKKI